MSNKKTGYNFIFDKQTVDISDIGAIAESGAPASFNLRDQGYETSNNNFMFFYTDTADPWKQKTGFNQFYISSFNQIPLIQHDIATNSSCPNFKKIIGFCGETDTAPDSSVRKLFKYSTTHRLRVKIWDNNLLFSFGDDATDGVNYHTHYKLKSKTGKLPSALIVGIQAQGGDGGDGILPPISATIAGNGGGAGDCQYIVLDFKKAVETVHNQSFTFLAFDFYIAPISNWSTIAYNDNNNTRFTNDCVAINVRNTFYPYSDSENLRSKIIVGCGQNGVWQNTTDNPGYGVAGTTMFYDLEASKVLTKAELNNYGIYILTKHKAETTANAGYGGAHESGKNSNAYGILATNIQSEATTANITKQLSNSQNEVLNMQTGGKAGNSSQATTRSGGGGASNFAAGGNGGNDGSGGSGALGSGGGGGSPNGSGGSGGLPYIFFCSNIDFSITKNIELSITKNSNYSDEASNSTYIAYLKKNNSDANSETIYIYPNTTSIWYPEGCDENNTLFYYNQSGYFLPKPMSEVAINTVYTACNASTEDPHWGYDIKFITK